MDNRLILWDVKPFVKGESRIKNYFYGHRHSIDNNLLRCSFNNEGDKVACGSSDSPSHVFIWDVNNDENKILYKLPGHSSTINEVVFHPNEPIILSCSSDKSIFLGELI